MTSLKDIQSLLAELDSILDKADARLPWSRSSHIARERRILERVRSYLVSQQQSFIASPSNLPLAAKPTQQEVLQQITQAVNRELTFVRTNVIQSLQADVEALRLQRETLIQEICQLEQKRQQLDSFSQPSKQEYSDQMLIILEANQRAIFDALQRDLQAYQASLSQGLERMHSLGAQGEMLFTVWLNHTLEQLKQQAPAQLATSVQEPEATNQTQEADISSTRSTPLPPSDPLSVSAPPPNEHPYQAPETGLSESERVGEEDVYSLFTDTQETDQADRMPSSPDLSVLLPEDGISENLNSDDWEMIEGLDSTNLAFELDDNEEIDPFIQLDINEQVSHPSVGQEYTPSPSDSQDLDFLLNWLNEKQQTDLDLQAYTVTELDNSEVAAELNQNVDRRRQEIDELYQSLFGTEPLPVENVLFEGLADPASQPTQEPPLDVVLFEDAAPPSPPPTDVALEAQSSFSTSNTDVHSHKLHEQDGIETITALTDLFETLGLTPTEPVIEGNSMSASTSHLSQPQTSDTSGEVNLVDDTYIPASADEDLLEISPLESIPNVEIRLNPSTLEQFQQDLYSFEQPLSENAFYQNEQWLPSHPIEESTPKSETEPLHQQDQQLFPMSKELLAEDWEEFVINQLRTPQELDDASIPTTIESVELDFDPDLFPSEVLELDQESTVNTDAVTAEELNPPEDLIAFEDENLVDEMQWDEPTDNTTEEAITSSELEFDTDALSQNVYDSDLENEARINESSDLTPDSTLPQASWENNSHTLSEAVINPEQQPFESIEQSTPENQVMTELEQVQSSAESSSSQNREQETKLPDESNFEVNCPQSDELNSEQSDHSSNINPDLE